MVRFDLKVLITRLLLVLDVCNMKPTYRRSWARNLLMFSDLTLEPSFKVKQWFTGFGELSFREYNFALVLRCIGLVLHFLFTTP